MHDELEYGARQVAILLPFSVSVLLVVLLEFERPSGIICYWYIN